jgi:hypothetical protein
MRACRAPSNSLKPFATTSLVAVHKLGWQRITGLEYENR